VNALDTAVVEGFGRRGERQLDLAAVRPRVERRRDHTAAIVQGHVLRRAAESRDVLEDRDHCAAGQRDVGPRRQALARAFIDDTEGAKAAPGRERVGDEVHGPLRVRPVVKRHTASIGPQPIPALGPSRGVRLPSRAQ
jgi:hypothetical protein